MANDQDTRNRHRVTVTLGNRNRSADFFEFLAKELRTGRLVSIQVEIPESGVGRGTVVLAASPGEIDEQTPTLFPARLSALTTEDTNDSDFDEAEITHIDVTFGEDESTNVGPAVDGKTIVPLDPGSNDD